MELVMCDTGPTITTISYVAILDVSSVTSEPVVRDTDSC